MAEQEKHIIHMTIKAGGEDEADVQKAAKIVGAWETLDIQKIQPQEDGTTVFNPRNIEVATAQPGYAVYRFSSAKDSDHLSGYTLFTQTLQFLREQRKENPSS